MLRQARPKGTIVAQNLLAPTSSTTSAISRTGHRQTLAPRCRRHRLFPGLIGPDHLGARLHPIRLGVAALVLMQEGQVDEVLADGGMIRPQHLLAKSQGSLVNGHLTFGVESLFARIKEGSRRACLPYGRMSVMHTAQLCTAMFDILRRIPIPGQRAAHEWSRRKNYPVIAEFDISM